jgi:outer membrane protein OmpA-like peptidoglycan-associated protein
VTCPAGTTWKDGACRGELMSAPAAPAAPVVDPNGDSDGDGVANGVDKCPTVREVFNGVNDGDGCPEGMLQVPPRYATLLTLVGDETILLQRPLAFDTAKPTLKKSTPNAEILDALADVFKVTGQRVRVECHSDAVGDDSYNLELSKARAASVRFALGERGVLGDSEGYGEDRPIDDNRTAEGRARNRRCEFHLR